MNLSLVRAAKLPHHAPLAFLLLLHLTLSFTYATLIPLGEAPDEPAHLNYARFIAQNGRLPTTLAEREAADYRANWPPLYHTLIALPIGWVGQAQPSRLKTVGDTARRLIPTNGQTIAAFIHTEDEAWPWRGLPLAWHLSRFVSVGLTALSVLITYLIAWHLARRRDVATLAAAIHAFNPQILFVGSVVNDDNLLILLSSLVLLMLVTGTQDGRIFNLSWSFGLGLLLGLATVAKYNALPLWGVVAVWYGYHLLSRRQAVTIPFPAAGLTLLGGAALTGGWWFLFIWQYFNQVGPLGWWRGSLAALVASASDASLRNLATERSLTLPGPTAWLTWFITLFQSFWAGFGGSSTINFPSWVYWLLAFFCLLAFLSRQHNPRSAALPIFHPTTFLFRLTPLFFLPLPLLRFILTGGNITETAQGRHLFPAISAIAFSLAWGLLHLPYRLPQSLLAQPANDEQSTRHLPGARRKLTLGNWPQIRPAALLFLVILFILSLTALPLIRRNYPPPIPLWTTAEAATVAYPLRADLGDGLTLLGFELGRQAAGAVPITLVWQATAIPTQDYLISLILTDEAQQPVGSWLGQPLGGRYPTRAWDQGDILRHTIPMALLPNSPATKARLSLQRIDPSGQPSAAPLTLIQEMPLSSPGPTLALPNQLRADGLPPNSPFTYRGTLSFILPGLTTTPSLLAPTGQIFPTAQFLANQSGSLAHFIVAADWPSGDYRLKFQPEDNIDPIIQSKIQNLTSRIQNRPRQFTPGPITHPTDATFGGQMTLLGYDLPDRRVKPGDSFPITLYWRAETTLGQNLTVFNHLLDAQLIQRGGNDRIPLNFYTTWLWVPGEIVSDSYEVAVEAKAPPGVYWLDVGLYPSERPDFSLPLVVEGQPIDRTSVSVGPIKVGGPPPAVTSGETTPRHPVKATFGDQIILLGFNLSDRQGDSIPLTQPFENQSPRSDAHDNLPTRRASMTNDYAPDVNLRLFWQATALPTTDYTVFIHLLDAQNNLVAQFDGPPANGAYPTSLWEPGEIITDDRLLSSLPEVASVLRIGLYRPDTGQRLLLPEGDDGLNLILFAAGQ